MVKVKVTNIVVIFFLGLALCFSVFYYVAKQEIDQREYDGKSQFALINAEKYKIEQDYFFRMNNFYNESLHNEEKFNKQNIRLLGFAKENALIKKHCPDCEFSSKRYKIASIYFFNEHTMFLTTLDSEGSFTPIKELKTAD